MRTRLVESPSAFETVVDGYVQRGYGVKSKDEYRAVVKANDWGSMWVHLFLLVFTVGFGNVVYGLYRFATRDEVEVLVRS